jgi:hypothetical protein
LFQTFFSIHVLRACRKFKEVKARPTSATADLSYIMSNPMVDRALRRARVLYDYEDCHTSGQRRGQWTDPACFEGEYPALQGEPDRWNSKFYARHDRRSTNPHKQPSRRSHGIGIQWVLLGVNTALKVLAREQPHVLWEELLDEVSQVPQGEALAALEHVTAYIHARCKFSTRYALFSLSSHLCANRLRVKGRSPQSSFCMAIAEDLIRVSQHAEPVVDPPEGGDVATIIPVYIMYYARLEWYSGANAGDGVTAHQRFAFVLLLPATRQDVYGHTVFRYQEADFRMESQEFHCLVPVESIVQPLIVDTSVEGSVTLAPFKGKGLEQVIDDEDYPAETGDMECPNLDTDVT